MSKIKKIDLDTGISAGELVACAMALPRKLFVAYIPDKKISVAEIRDITADFLRCLASKAHPEFATMLEYLAEAIDVDPPE